MDSEVTGDRRRGPRQRYRGGVLPPSARIRPGREVVVVDLCAGGALVEGIWRLRPGGRVELQLGGALESQLVRARITRCYVCALDRVAPVRYRAALAFDAPVALPPTGDLLAEYPLPPPRAPGRAEREGHTPEAGRARVRRGSSGE